MNFLIYYFLWTLFNGSLVYSKLIIYNEFFYFFWFDYFTKHKSNQMKLKKIAEIIKTIIRVS